MILVTGGTGFIGRNLVSALLEEGDDVRVLARRPDGPVAVRLRQAGAEIVGGDVRDPDDVRKAAAGISVAYHLAGGYRGQTAELWATHAEGTANLLDAVDHGTHVVYVSSTAVYGWDQAWPADESSPVNPATEYGRAKVAAEELVRAWRGGSTVIVRPTITYGPDDGLGMLARAVRLMGRRVRRFPGTGANRVHLIHIDDLVRGLIAAGDRGTGVYVMGGPKSEPIGRILALLAHGAGLPAPPFGLPARPLASLGGVVESVWTAARLPGSAPLSRHSVDVATRDRAYSWARAAADLGWRPEIGIDDGIPPVGAALAGGAKQVVAAPKPVKPGGGALGFDWRNYLDDPDEGLGTVYERFALDDVLADAVARTGATSVLHAPLFGMMGFPGLDTVMLARRGIRVGLLDHDPDRLAAVHEQWLELGLKPETHLMPGPDPSSWPERLPTHYDLVFSFAALWWFDDADGVVAAQARWADKGVLCCVPNRNVFMRMRAGLWHRDLFKHLNEDALDAKLVTRAGADAGLQKVATGLFDIPPFPDTSVPLAKLLRARRGKSAPAEGVGEAAWAWSILPFLKGEDPGMKDRVARIARWERFLPSPMAPGLAHHRYLLFVPDGDGDAADRGAATHTS
ncbi:MAG: hypothetical protein QOE93_1650 [Actinomycetota bacterium]|nr:hypothetical protein [Actinomycetota bacterium]